MPFDLGSITKGITKGFEYIGKVGRVMAWGLAHGHSDCVSEGVHVLDVFSHEVLDEAGAVKGNLLALALTGDPMSGSRHAAQTFLTKWGAQAGVK